jgi:hypothetical protein
MMTYLFMFVYFVIILLLMVLETYSIYEYRTCTNYDNRPYYNDCVFICDNRPYYNDYVFIYDLLSLFE